VILFKEKFIWLMLFIPFLWHGLGDVAGACPACWAGYGKGDERFNKPLADLRIVYEKNGKEALPYIKNALKTSSDPLVIKRAAGYIVELNDRGSIPLLEDMLLALVKRVAFSNFGLDTYEFKGRLAVAHALAKFGPTTFGDRIWKKYDRLDFNRKSEIPYILNALKDPKMTKRLVEIINREEDHQLMVGALDALATGGGSQVLPVLKAKILEWGNKQNRTSGESKTKNTPMYYSVLRIRAELAITAIEDRKN